MPNPTCRLLSNGYKFDLTDSNSSLLLKPCCMFPDDLRIPLDNVDMAEIKKYRDQLIHIDSYQHPGCHQCNYFDKKQLRKTWRDWSFDIVPNDAESGDASYLELQLDKTCNGGCIICGPHNSSFWQNEIGTVIPSIRRRTPDIVNSILDIVDITKTRKILFLGGEPFLSQVDETLLPQIPDPSQVDLQYTVNGSVYPSEDRIKHWKGFRSVLINFSIDGVDSRFDYIRYPLKWQTVQTNMLRMLAEMPDSVRFKINHTINVMNLYYYDEFQQWKDRYFQFDRHDQPIPYNFSPAVGILSPKTVTPRLYDKLVTRYGIDSKPVRTVIDQHDKLDAVLHFLDTNDRRRGLDWRLVFPDLVDCLV